MAKRHNERGETPIEFHIPGMGKLPRAPIPINQSNWVYKFITKIEPTPANIITQFVFTLLFLGMIGFILFALLEYLQSWFAKTILLILLLAALYIWGLLAIGSFNLYRQFKNKQTETVPEREIKKKRLPKRRKDFR